MLSTSKDIRTYVQILMYKTRLKSFQFTISRNNMYVQGGAKVLDPPIIQNMAYSDRFMQKL